MMAVDLADKASNQDFMENFWGRIAPQDSGCWEWTGAHNHKEYGQIRLRDGSGRTVVVTRIMYALCTGQTPSPDLHVCHRCDNPPCVNPEHLFLGTRRDNMRDMVRKGRNKSHFPLSIEQHPRGEAHGRAKITADDVRAIRLAATCGETGKSIGARYGICQTTANRIALRQIWAHVPEVTANAYTWGHGGEAPK